MLTKKELIKFRNSKGKLHPAFIDVNDENLIALSQALCDIFSKSFGKTRREHEEECDQLLSLFEVTPVVAQGLLKLYFDTVTFEQTTLKESAALREKIFQSAFAFLASSPDQYRELVCEQLKGDVENVTLETLSTILYSDLPEFHKVTELKEVSSQSLLQKYNVALIQGMLFYSRELKIVLPAFGKYRAQFRYLLRRIKFYQLVVRCEKEDSSFVLYLDGPLSLFAQTQKYGFQLACFFPSLLQMPEWELSAFIEMGKEARGQGELSLSQKNKLISHHKNFSAYIPEEFRLFQENFAKHPVSSEWMLCEDADDVLFDGEHYFFPDFAFVHKKEKRVVYLELFHSWHKSALEQRLRACVKKKPDFPLLMGASTALVKKNQEAAFGEAYPYFQDHGFVFRDVISMDKLGMFLL